MIGLRKTKAFDDVLEARNCRDSMGNRHARTVQEIVQTSLMLNRSDSRLLFPFLFVEANRAQKTDSFDEMVVQTAFPIRHSLQLQWNLEIQPVNYRAILGGPLVWILAYHGEDWRVYAAHIQLKQDQPHYVSICVDTLSTVLMSSRRLTASGEIKLLVETAPCS